MRNSILTKIDVKHSRDAAHFLRKLHTLHYPTHIYYASLSLNMMKQAEHPTYTPHLGNDRDTTAVAITLDERISVLQKQSKDAVLKSRGKKDLLQKFVTRRHDLLEHAKLFDGLQNSNLSECLSRVLPKTKAACSRVSNNELSSKFTALLDPLKLLHDQLRCQEVQAEEAVSHLRQRREGFRTRDPALVLLEEYLQIMDKVDQAVYAQRNSSDSDAKLRSVVLTSTQRQRTFDPLCVPQDETYRCCLFCGCESINEPPENVEVVEYNTRTDDDFAKKHRIWTKYLAAKEKNQRTPPPNDPITKKEMKRAPTRVKARSQILQCMCSTSKCVLQGSDISSTCPINCIDHNTNTRFPFTGAPTQSCSCTICNCTCSMAYHAKDTAVIVLKLMQKMNTETKTSNVDATPSVHQFMGGMIAGGLQAAYTSMYADVQQQSNNGRKSSKDDVVRRTEQVFYDTAAQNIARKGGHGGLGSEGRQLLAKGFGTSTMVKLPQGQIFDTKAIGGNANFHHRNNRLSGEPSGIGFSTSTTPLHPGMVSNQEINYDQPLDREFLAALSGNDSFVSLVSPPSKLPERSDINMNNNSTDTVINLLNLDDDEMTKKMSASAMPMIPTLRNTERVTNPSPNKIAWERVKSKNKILLHLDKRGTETLEEKKCRKKAKKTGKHMLKKK